MKSSIDKQLYILIGKDNFTRIKNYTTFCKKVWLATLKIPYGEVRTYKWVANKIGHPKAYRAVGSALRKNPLAPLIPCHRVVGSKGKIGGYSKGISSKIKLLKEENVDLNNFIL
ncbi:MAG: MGMT family protein [Endomicrobia bacterium]|nr:MGMT family protein [Endomicrobiia bacterium]